MMLLLIKLLISLMLLETKVLSRHRCWNNGWRFLFVALINWPIDQFTNWSIDQFINLPIDQLTNQLINWPLTYCVETNPGGGWPMWPSRNPQQSTMSQETTLMMGWTRLPTAVSWVVKLRFLLKINKKLLCGDQTARVAKVQFTGTERDGFWYFYQLLIKISNIQLSIVDQKINYFW